MSDGVPSDAETGERGQYQGHDGANVSGTAGLLTARRTFVRADMKSGVRSADPIDAAARQGPRLRPADGERRDLQRRGAAVQAENRLHPFQRQF
jgi:hypothetical protein